MKLVLMIYMFNKNIKKYVDYPIDISKYTIDIRHLYNIKSLKVLMIN